MEDTFQIQRILLEKWNCVKIIQIVIRRFHQKNKLTIKIYSNLSHIKIHYYLKLRIPMGQRLFFRRIAQNREYIQTFCNDRKILSFLHVANGFDKLIHNVIWYNYMNSYTKTSIIFCILVQILLSNNIFIWILVQKSMILISRKW